MGINYEVVMGMVVLVGSGLGLSLSLKFIKSIKKRSRILSAMWIFESQRVRFAVWLILGSLFVKPFIDLSTLLINFSKVPFMMMESVTDRDLPPNWDISHFVLFLVIKIMLFGLVYGYAVWIVPKLLALLSSKNGVFIKPKSFLGACIVIATGSLLYGLLSPLAFGIQQLPILVLPGSKDSIATYFFGWLTVLILLPIMLYGLSGILRNNTKSPIIIKPDLLQQSLEM